MWPDPAQNDANTKWVRDYYDAIAPHSEAGGYINFMADDDQDRIKANYKGNYERLVEVKRKYDPDNLFHLNQNINLTPQVRRVPVTSGRSRRSARSSRGQGDAGRAGVLLEVTQPSGAGDRDDVLALGQHPRERDLRGRGAVAIRDGADPLDDGLVRIDRRLREARERRAEVVRVGRAAVVIVPVRKPRPSGANGMNAAPFAAHHGTTSSRRSVNHSESSDWTVATGWIACARSSSSTLASDMPSARTFPAPTSSAMAPHDSSSGTSGIDAVELVQVDHVRPEPAERPVDRLADVLGSRVVVAAGSRRSGRRPGRPWSPARLAPVGRRARVPRAPRS